MTYLGSKDKIHQFIINCINRYRKPGQVYIEPFMGSGAIISRMPGPRIGSDAMIDLMMLWDELVRGVFVEPPYITKEQYDELMKSETHSALRAYAGFFWSFSGMFAKGYSPEFYKNSRSFYSAMERAKLLEGAMLAPIPYYKYTPSQWSGAVFYCDPPYIQTTGYRGVEPFDYDRFYYWCKEMSKNNIVLISEYWMPPEKFVIVDQERKRIGLKRTDDDNDRIEMVYMPR
jgi:DNA adenine methylase